MGSDSSSWNSVLGPHSIGECNANGELLLDFCASNQLIVSNTWFQHKLLHQATWFRNSDRSRLGHMIDYILLNKRFHTSVLDTRVYHLTLNESDHEFASSTLHFRSRPNVDRQVPCVARPPICPPLIELVTNLLSLNHQMTSSLLSPLSGTHSKPQSRRPVSLYLLPQDLVTQTGLPMTSATYPARSKKPGSVSRRHHPKTPLDSSSSTTI